MTTELRKVCPKQYKKKCQSIWKHSRMLLKVTLAQNTWINKHGNWVHVQVILISVIKFFLEMISLIWGLRKYCDLHLIQRILMSIGVPSDKLTSCQTSYVHHDSVCNKASLWIRFLGQPVGSKQRHTSQQVR